MTDDIKVQVAAVAAAYFQHNHVPPAEIPEVMKVIAESLGAIGSGPSGAPSTPAEASPAPAVGVRTSVKPDRLICLFCGKSQKTLKRHISSAHGMTPHEYRSHWGLRADYPMIAPDYSAARSALAKTIGLGQLGKKNSRGPKGPVGRAA